VATIEITCPNCGASGGVAGPHETRICEFCGTHYLLRPVANPPQAEERAYKHPSGPQADMSAIVIAIMVMLLLIGGAAIAIVIANSDETPSNRTTPSYYSPRR
jgi:hypothetical protein